MIALLQVSRRSNNNAANLLYCTGLKYWVPLEIGELTNTPDGEVIRSIDLNAPTSLGTSFVISISESVIGSLVFERSSSHVISRLAYRPVRVV